MGPHIKPRANDDDEEEAWMATRKPRLRKLLGRNFSLRRSDPAPCQAINYFIALETCQRRDLGPSVTGSETKIAYDDDGDVCKRRSGLSITTAKNSRSRSDFGNVDSAALTGGPLIAAGVTNVPNAILASESPPKRSQLVGI